MVVQVRQNIAVIVRASTSALVRTSKCTARTRGTGTGSSSTCGTEEHIRNTRGTGTGNGRLRTASTSTGHDAALLRATSPTAAP
jgi:hypothetical protein